MTSLEMNRVVKTFPGNVQAVDDFTLETAAGELMVLVGPSGSGKTTVLRMIAGLETVTQGTICLDGRVVNNLRPKDRQVALVFQNTVLYPHMTVADNMAFGLRLRRVGKAEIRRRISDAAEVLEITDLLRRRPREISGGQQRRVALGRAIISRPRLFLLDEPLSNLDADLRSQMRHEIRRLHARLGATMLYVTHDQTEAMTLGQRIAVLWKGRIQQVADPATLYDEPANRFVAASIGTPAMNFFDGRIERRDGRLTFAEADFTLPIPETWTARLEHYLGKPITLGIRPENIGSPDAERAADPPRITASIEATERIGPVCYVYFRCGSQTFVSLAGAAHHVQVGSVAQPAVATDHLHFFDPQTQDAVTRP